MLRKLQEKFFRLITFCLLKRLVSYFLIGGAILVVLLFLSFHFAYLNRPYPGVTILGQSIGNLTATEAQLKIKQLVQHAPESIELFTDGQRWTLNLADFKFSYEPEATVRQALLIGRNESPLKNLETQIRAWSSKIDLNLEYQLNQKLLADQIATIAAQVYLPTIEPQIKIVNQQVIIEPGKIGQELEQTKLMDLIDQQLANFNFDSIRLPIKQTASLISKNQIEMTRLRAEKLRGRKMVFVYQENQWTVNDEQLINFLSFNGNFNQEKIASQAANLASVIDRPAQNATFQFAGNRVVEFRPATDGLALNQKETAHLIEETLIKAEKNNVSSDQPLENKIYTLVLPVIKTPPAITVDQINNLGIKELLGEGVSNYAGSPASRIHNLNLASSRLNGILIPPGEIFSFNQTLGEISEATGYQSALVIKEGRTILGDGGGVCQVSTTLFRAALNTGLPVIERHPHAYRVGYYEQGGFGPGLDATVWQPGVDLKFKNDTPAHLLIQAKNDSQSKSLIFEFYGTNDGRQISVSKPKVWVRTAPPPDLYQDDPTLAMGTTKQIEKSIWGAKVSVDWKVVRGEEVLQERTFYSHYQPWQAVYLRGTKTNP